MCIYTNFFRSSLYSAIRKILSTFVQVIRKWLGTNEMLCTKSHSQSKFSKLSLGLFCAIGTGCTPIFRFSLRRQMAPQWTANFRTAYLRQCRSNKGNDRVASTVSITSQFPMSENWMCFATHWTFRGSVGKWRHKIRKYAVEIFQDENSRSQRVHAKYFLWLLLK